MRAALGATPRALLRPLLLETLLLFALGGVAGVFLAAPAGRALHAFLPEFPIPIELALEPDWRVGLFALAATVGAGILFGALPAAAAAARVDLVGVLGHGGRGFAGGRRAGQSTFLALQVALSLVLLVGALVFARELARGRALDAGFDVDASGYVTVDLRLLSRAPAGDLALLESWLERARATPGVEAASLARVLPLGLAQASTRVQVEGLVPPSAEGFPVRWNAVSPGYFETLGIPLLGGRDFAASDRAAKDPVAIVSRSTAARLFPGAPAIGRALRHEGRSLRVVGVVGDVVAERRAGKQALFFYVPFAQRPAPRASLVVRSRGAQPLEPLRRELRALEPDAPLLSSGRLATHAQGALFAQRLAAAVAGAFGLLGLLLASVGLYGLVAFFAAERRGELALRVALGARAADLRRLVVWSGLRPVAVGTLLGLPAAWAFARLAGELVPGMGKLDPQPFVAGALLVVAVAALAAYMPARRATRRPAIEGLRAD